VHYCKFQIQFSPDNVAKEVRFSTTVTNEWILSTFERNLVS